MDNSDQRWLTISQAAEYLGVSPRTVANLRTHEGLPATHMGGRIVRFDRLALDEWAAARTSKNEDLDALRPSRRGGTDRAHRVRAPGLAQPGRRSARR